DLHGDGADSHARRAGRFAESAVGTDLGAREGSARRDDAAGRRAVREPRRAQVERHRHARDDLLARRAGVEDSGGAAGRTRLRARRSSPRLRSGRSRDDGAAEGRCAERRAHYGSAGPRLIWAYGMDDTARFYGVSLILALLVHALVVAMLWFNWTPV